MPIQIGMSCDPQWLCDGIGWVIAILVILMILGLIRVVHRDVRKSGQKDTEVHRSARKTAASRQSHHKKR